MTDQALFDPAPFDPHQAPPLRDVIRDHGLDARKSLGQNFLLDLNITCRIARLAELPEGCHVLEVGPGPGGLTRALLGLSGVTVTAVERDHRCVEALTAYLAPLVGDRFRLIEGDAMTVDPLALCSAPRAVVANLPYNVATPLLLGWLARIDQFHCLTLMFQREVADRLTAQPRTKDYGRLSVITQWAAHPRMVMTLPARAFTPPPKVDSAVVRLTPRADREPADWRAMETVTAAAFGQRRKMLRQSLKSLGPVEPLLEAAGLSETARAEEVPVAGFAALAMAWRRSQAGEPATG